MNLARRIAVVIAAAAALAVLAATLCALLVEPASGGWFMYAPESEPVPFSPSDDDTLQVAAVWLVAIGVWLAVAWRMFRPPPMSGDRRDQ